MLILPRRKLLFGAAASLLGAPALIGRAAAQFSGGGGAVSAIRSVAPPAAAAWTQKGFGVATTLTDVPNGVQLLDAGQSTDTWRGAIKTAPSAPYTLDAIFQSNLGQFCTVGLGWSDGTKSHFVSLNTQGSGYVSAVFHASAFGATGYVTETGPSYVSTNPQGFLRVNDDGTNAKFYYSADGVNFTLMFTTTKSGGYLGSSGYTNLGFFLNSHFTNAAPTGSLPTAVLTSWYLH